MRWAIQRDASGLPVALHWLGPETEEEKKAREEAERKRRVASKRKPYPEAVAWCEARGLLDEDGCLR